MGTESNDGTITANHILMSVGENTSPENNARWLSEDDVEVVVMQPQFTGATPDRSASLVALVEGESGGNGTAFYVLGSADGGSNASYISIKPLPFSDGIYSDAILGYMVRNQKGTLHYGDYTAAFTNAISTSAYTMYTRTIKANSLGTKGWVYTRVICHTFNNSAANRTYTLTYDFGAYTITATATGQGASATNYATHIFEVWTYNNQAQNAQLHLIHYIQKNTNAADTFLAATNDAWAWGSSAVTTTSDVTLDMKITSSNSTATQTVTGVGFESGPYYG